MNNLYPNLCCNEVCYKGCTILVLDVENLVSAPVMKCPLCGLDMLLKPKKDNKG